MKLNLEQPSNRDSRKEGVVTAEEILANAQELSRDTVFLLSEDYKFAEKYLPLQNIGELSLEGSEQVATTYGRLMSFNVVKQRFPEWAKKIEQECQALIAHSHKYEIESVTSITKKIAEFSELLMASDINTNSAGSGTGRQKAMKEYFGEYLKSANDREAYKALYNPFHLEQGTVLFQPKSEGRWSFSLEEVRLGDIVIDGKDSAVDIAGETIPIESINRDLACGNLMLRDGSNILGAPDKIFEVPKIEAGQKTKITFLPNPVQQDNSHIVEFLGTNEDELRERYGDAYLPFVKRLLIVRFRFEGKETEALLGEIVGIDPIEN